MQFFESRLNLSHRTERGELRSLRKFDPSLIDFASNDYLGFANSVDIAQIAAKLFPDENRKWGSTGSRLLTGNHDYLELVEDEISKFHGHPSALLCSSGYLANLAVLSALPNRRDIILYDSLIHASMRDGIRLSPAKAFSFRHNDLGDLEQKLIRYSDILQKRSTSGGQCIIVVESVYSMDGDEAPLVNLVGLAERYGALIIIDEAHALGTRGQNGEGLVSAFGLQSRVFATVVTFGKALGAHGAAILGGNALKNYLLNMARPVIYTTAPDFHSVARIQASYLALKSGTNQIHNLHSICSYMIKNLKKVSHMLGAKIEGPIIPLIIPGAERVREVASFFHKRGYLLLPVFAPTVARGQERIRICLHSFNTKLECNDFLGELRNVM